MLPHSEACERNKAPILEHLKLHFKNVKSVLEIGSGTAQHAVYFAENMPNLLWQTSDRAQYLKGIIARLDYEGGDNIKPPLLIDVENKDWQLANVDAVYSANTLHIMSEQNVEQFFEGVGRVVSEKGVLVVYGPFKYKQQFTSPSNAAFDASLRSQSASMGIRDIEKVVELAGSQGFKLIKDYDMPANNQLLVWSKS